MDVAAVTSATNDLSSVSSQYGPGPVFGWLLVAISVLLSWIFVDRGKKKDKSSCISADFVTTIIFPIIAIGDIAVQLYNYPGSIADITITEEASLQRKIHALEAPLVVVEGTMMVGVFLFVAAIYQQHPGQAAILGAINICSLCIETVLLAKTGMHDCKRPHKNFSRSFIANSIPLLVIAWIVTILPLCHLVVSYLATRYLRVENPSGSQPGAESQIPDMVASISGRVRRTNPFRKRMKPLLVTLHVVCSVYFIVLGNLASNSVAYASNVLYTAGYWEACTKAAKLFFIELVPRTQYSIMDLDQMLPIVAGGCILLLNVYTLVRQKI